MATLITVAPVLTPTQFDLTIRAGVTLWAEFESLLDNGTALDVTTATLAAEVRATDGRLLATLVPFVVESQTSGRFAVRLPQVLATQVFEDFREFFPARWSCKAQFAGTFLGQSSFRLAEGAVNLLDRQTESAASP